jgi:hypothetical protein
MMTMTFVCFINRPTPFSVVLDRKRKFFTGALTQGRLWRFFTAHDRGTRIRIYTSAVFSAEKDQGLIVELLKDMVNSLMTLVG